MKKSLLVLVLLSLLVSACGFGAASAAQKAPVALQVTDGAIAKSYTAADLQKLPVSVSSFNGVSYEGVALPVLLQDAGFDPQLLKAVKATATDGFSANYDPSMFQRQDVLVAYATSTGALAKEDGSLRMVLPDQPGKVNVRMLAELKVVK